MKKIFSLLYLVLLSSCNENIQNEKYEKKSVESKFSLLIPESLGQVNKLNSIASIQFENKSQDFYIMVLDESKDAFTKAVDNKVYDTTANLDGYYKVVVNHFKEITSNDFKVYNIEKKKINHSNAIVFSMSGINDGYPAFYRYAIIESNKRYYQIMSWTNTSQEEKYTERMNKIIDSFKIEETNHSHLNGSEKTDDEIQEIGHLYKPEKMQHEKIETKTGKNDYRYTLTSSDLLDTDLQNIKIHSRKIVSIYYKFLIRINSPFNYNKIIIKIIHRNGKIDIFEYSEKEMKGIIKE
jgi:hypothetical protein